MTLSIDAIFTIKVLEANLDKDTLDGTDLFGIAIKFALATEELRGDVNADERQAKYAVTKATETVNVLGSPPTVVDRLNSTIDNGNKVANEAQAFRTTWSVLLKRIELSNKIVADIAEVFGAFCLHTSRSQRDTDSPIYVAGLVSYISCDPGLSVARHIYCRRPLVVSRTGARSPEESS